MGEFSGLSSSACFASSVESPHYLCLFGGLSLLAPSIGSVTSSVLSGCAGGGTGGRARRQRKGMGSSGGRSISGDSRSGDEGRVPRVTASVDICVVGTTSTAVRLADMPARPQSARAPLSTYALS